MTSQKPIGLVQDVLLFLTIRSEAVRFRPRSRLRVGVAVVPGSLLRLTIQIPLRSVATHDKPEEATLTMGGAAEKVITTELMASNTAERGLRMLAGTGQAQRNR